MTVTDANVVLGRVDPDYFLGGDMPLEPELARRAVARIGQEMGRSAEEAALGIVRVVNVNIDRALRRISIARGHDPRGFTLVAFGGAGPLHACAVAEQLGIPRILVPRYPGVLCALGLLMADLVVEQVRSVLQPVVPGKVEGLARQLETMAAEARAALIDEGVDGESIILHRMVDARYRGQSYELTIPLETDLTAAFHAAHKATYGHAMRERTVEVVNLRLQATGLVAAPELSPEPLVTEGGVGARIGEKSGFIEGSGFVPIGLYERSELPPGALIAGPALVFQMDSTVFIRPDWEARVDGYRNLILERT